MNKIEIYGKEYPCRLTMGALMRFKQRTGKELSDLGTDLTLLASLARCCVESACAADGVAAPEEDEQRFADALTMDKVSEFALMVAAGDDGAKKAGGTRAVGIDELLALALGSMGMSLDDFARLSPRQFDMAYGQWHTTHVREPWEMARFMACCTLQPYSKRALKARDVCRFAWDDKDKDTAAARTPHGESTRQRWEEMMGRCGQ